MGVRISRANTAPAYGARIDEDILMRWRNKAACCQARAADIACLLYATCFSTARLFIFSWLNFAVDMRAAAHTERCYFDAFALCAEKASFDFTGPYLTRQAVTTIDA